EALQTLAERLSAPVVDLGARFNFPSTHPLEAAERRVALLRDADVIFAVDVVDLWGALRANAERHLPAAYAPAAGARGIPLSVNDLLVRSWTSDFQRVQPVDLRLVGESCLALPALVDLLTTSAAAANDRASRADQIAKSGAAMRADFDAEARAFAGTT